jgi:hypothetical protein
MTDKKPETDKKVKNEKAEEKPIEKMTVVELREIAKGIEGITGVHAMKKDQLLAAIKENKGDEAAADTEPVKAEEKPKKKVPKKVEEKVSSVKQLKEKAAKLREEKISAREANDKNKVTVLRRRINRLKKMTRKAAQG